MANAIEDLLNETIAKGIAQGVEQGRVEGREEGRADGERRMLRRLLSRRFGAIPAALNTRIDRAETDELETLFDQAATATDLADLD